jgi:nucleotide-binding universal stress UspA family protein
MKGVTEKILVVHNIGSKISKGLDKASLAALEKESKDRLEAYCSKLEQWEMATEYHLSMGKTVPEIMRLSRDHNATMIVMGKTGKDWFQEYWLGGVSHRLAELSELPVLLAP